MKHSLKRFASLSLAVVLTMQGVFRCSASSGGSGLPGNTGALQKALPMKRSHLKTQMMQMSTPL